MNKKQIVATIATGVAVAGLLKFFFNSEKGIALRKKMFEREKNPKEASGI